MNRAMLLLSLAWAVALYVLHYLAVKHSLYWMIWWYDIPMHLIGGAVLGGLLGGLLFSLRKHFLTFTPSRWMTLSLALVLVGGIIWEIFEYFFNLFYNPYIGYSLDTIKDLFMDVAGAFLVVRSFRDAKVPTKI